MLDPDDTTSRTESTTDDAPAAARAPRKRTPRKAVAKAGPPAVTADAPATPTSQSDAPAAGAPATDAGGTNDAVAAPVKTPRKRTAKKAAAKAAPAVAAPASGSDDAQTSADAQAPADAQVPAGDAQAPAAAPTRAPRKRAAKKSAVPDVPNAPAGEGTPAPESDAAAAVTADAPGATETTAAPVKTARKRAPRKATAKTAATDASATDAGTPDAGTPDAAAPAPGGASSDAPAAEPAAPQVPGAPAVLFMAPTEAEPEKPRRRRAAKKAAPVAATDETAPGTAESDDATADPTAPDTATTDSATTDAAAKDTAASDQTDEDETADPEDVREAAIEQASGARRRRRRGRRGRGGGANARTEGEESDEDETADDEQASDATDDTEDAEESGGSTGSRRRRRRRRSGTSDDSEGTDDPPNTVTHVRDGGTKKSDDDGVRGVKGSTRLEAKRQRRRDGRETNRRRAPILTESEFLARREAVDRVMAVRQQGDRTQIAVLEDDILVEHYVTRASSTSYVGNVYLGRVQNVLPSMEAAFIDIGKGRNGVLYAGEVNWDAAGLEGKSRAIENALKSGDSVLVQVTKDPIGHKGARLTSQVSLPGRFLVLVPGGGMTGISRRLPDTERHRLKSILKKIVPDDAGVIVRTAAEGASEEDLTHDVERLTAQWEQIQEKAKNQKSAPTLVHGEPDIAIRVVRDVFNEDFDKLTVQGDDAWTTLSDYINGVAPDLAPRLSRHGKDTDLFHDLRVDEQLMKALDRKVWLPSGGSLVIDRTEAMTVIDVNTGKFVGSGGNLEQTVTRNNIEAAEEIVRQLRLRDVGGIVVIDFIDMVLESNRDLVLRRLTECLGRDRTKHQVAEVTSLGLVQMTRKRVGEGLLEAFSETCEHCHGRGILVHTDPVDKSDGGSSDHDDDRQGNGRGKRRRGGKGGGSHAAEPIEVPAANDGQRQAANAAIAAIHRAAGGEKPESGIALVDELASGLFNAALDAEQPRPVGSDAGARSSAPVETDAVAQVDAPATAQVDAPAEPAPSPQAAQPGADGATDDQPAPRRRRRVATRAASAPPAAEPTVVVVDSVDPAPASEPAPEPEPEPAPAPASDDTAPSEPEQLAAAEPPAAVPVTEPQADAAADADSTEASAPAPRRRRRAASRPAGPPTN